MKKFFLLSIVFTLVLTLTVQSQTVYVTKSGTKYHSAGCRYLKSSSIPISLADAKAKGYSPCSVCNPPTIVKSQTKEATSTQTTTPKQTETKQTQPQPTQTQQKSTNAPTQCTAITKSGKRCTRMTTDPSGKCWQHKDK